LLRAPFEWQRFSPLFHAIDRGLEEAADWLRDRGAFLDAWEASRLGDLEALIALHGQDPILLQGRREHWWATPLHAATTPECAAFLLEQGAEVNAIDGPKQCITPLHLAVEHGLALTEVLLAHGADANAVSPVMGQPLHTAVSGYQHRAPEQWQHCAALLLQHGADLEGSYNADNPGWTPLLDAVKKPHLAAARFLIEQGANVHAQDQYGQSVRHFAEKRCPELVPTLNERGA
jgi:ankyrin repeat protein